MAWYNLMNEDKEDMTGEFNWDEFFERHSKNTDPKLEMRKVQDYITHCLNKDINLFDNIKNS